MSDYIIPFLFPDANENPDIIIGKNSYGTLQNLPIPIPPELLDEFSGLDTFQVRNVEFWKTNTLTVYDYSSNVLCQLDATGNLQIKSDLTVNGNDIKSSTNATAITLSNADVAVQGDLTVNGNDIKSSTGATAITLTGSNVGIPAGNLSVSGTISAGSFSSSAMSFSGTDASIVGNLGVGGTVTAGSFSANSKLFDIQHPTKEGKRLRHGSLEGPELGVYVRGKTINNVITLPDYWYGLVDFDSITAHLTATDVQQTLCVNNITKTENNEIQVHVSGNNDKLFYYYILAERKDIPQLEVETNA